MKIALIFGTFNPLTNAHIRIGRLAKEAFPEAQVIYVPAKDAFLKGWKGLRNSAMDGRTRLTLMREAFKDYGFIAEDIELSTDISGKTFDTVEALKQKYGSDEAILVFGTDKLKELHLWYRSRELVSGNRFLIVTRDHETLDTAASPLVKEFISNFTEVRNSEYDTVSSTEVRKAYLTGHLEKIKDSVPPAVYEYLSTHKGVYKIMDYGFRKAVCATFDIKLGNIPANTESILNSLKMAETRDADILLFPELCLTGYTCGDMFLRKDVVDKALEALVKIKAATEGDSRIIAVGLPLRDSGMLFNCAALLSSGRILAVVPKTYLPNYNEFYEKRWFASAFDSVSRSVRIDGDDIPFGTDIIVETSDGMRIGVEICEDLWVAAPPSSKLALAGANVILNPSASNEIISKRAYRRNLVSMQSAKCIAAYVYASAGSGESTTDVVYSGHCIIAECGSVKGESHSYILDGIQLTEGIFDLEKIENDRVKMNSFRPKNLPVYRRVYVEHPQISELLPASVRPYPFVPKDKADRDKRCREILEIQAAGLATRLRKTGIKKCVIGISGGLDSTLALLVTKEAYRMAGLPVSDIITITMPGFGTTKQTKTSADRLMELLGTDARTIDITEACRLHMKDIGQPEGVYDVTYENIQARERTQILMDVANKEGGLVVGTGDLSELALGWCTYNGDHMSMYAVNVSIPKTLVKFIIETYAERCDKELRDVLFGVLGTTISPELLPPDEAGNIRQSTEETIGKYDLHDFFLYYYVRCGFSREKIERLAFIAFPDISRAKITETLDIFMKRFRSNQFKRNCIPDGPKVGSVALSPRGDWRMPSDYQG